MDPLYSALIGFTLGIVLMVVVFGLALRHDRKRGQ